MLWLPTPRRRGARPFGDPVSFAQRDFPSRRNPSPSRPQFRTVDQSGRECGRHPVGFFSKMYFSSFIRGMRAERKGALIMVPSAAVETMRLGARA